MIFFDAMRRIHNSMAVRYTESAHNEIIFFVLSGFRILKKTKKDSLALREILQT